MRVCLYTNIISPHQLPLAREIVVRIGSENYRYIYTEAFHAERAQLGWSDAAPSWCIPADSEEAKQWLASADLLISGHRATDLFASRAEKGLRTYYFSERWFKPPIGMLRLLHPSYFKMAVRMVRLIRSGKVLYLPIGVHAAADMARLVGFLGGDMRCLFRAPKISFERHPMGTISGYPWMRMWGYFVEKGIGNREQVIDKEGKALRVLWVGRMLKLKRVDTIIRAVAEVAKRGKQVSCTIVGSGPEEPKLKKLANSIVDLHLLSRPNSLFTFFPSVPIGEVRSIMRQHDVYVFSSNGYDGWGAVVSEALEEGMVVLGTYESGAPATMLPDSQLFHCGDWRTLAQKLSSLQLQPSTTTTVPKAYTAQAAAEWLLDAKSWSKK